MQIWYLLRGWFNDPYSIETMQIYMYRIEIILSKYTGLSTYFSA